LKWLTPVFDGGSPVLDFRVWFDNAGSSFRVLASGVIPTQYNSTSLT